MVGSLAGADHTSPATYESQKRTLGQTLGLSWNLHTRAFVKHFGSPGNSPYFDIYCKKIDIRVTVLVSYCTSFLGPP